MTIPNIVPAVTPVQPAVQPVVAAQPVAVVPAKADILFATPTPGVATAASGVVAVQPEYVLENPEGPAPYKVVNALVIDAVLTSGHNYFVSILDGTNTDFQISY